MDIMVLVVAADDGIMPQTREVLDLIQREKLNMVIAINKIDKPGMDIVGPLFSYAFQCEPSRFSRKMSKTRFLPKVSN